MFLPYRAASQRGRALTPANSAIIVIGAISKGAGEKL
jgi:hypothetical protein